MSELLNQSTSSFAQLAARYDDFRKPCCQIKAGGKDLAADLQLHIDSLEIDQTIKEEPGQCRFSIVNGYDLKTGRFQEVISANLPLGMEITAGIGYGQVPILFKGYIADISFSFAEGAPPTVAVVCQDIRALMQQGRLNAMPMAASFLEVMASLLSYYASLVKMKVIYLDAWNLHEDFRQNTNDLNYIYDYAHKRGYEFFVLGEYCYFRKKWFNNAPITKLEWGRGLLSFRRSFTYSASKLKGALNDMLSLLPFSMSELVKPGFPVRQVTDTKIDFNLDTSDAKNVLDLINIVASSAQRVGDDMLGGEVSCVGLPDLVPGRYIQLAKLDPNLLDKTYYIETAKHSFSSNGYTTTFSITSGL